eukprot:TRINITY_DN3085_c0_g1_i2.p1 TRINITY_DN3085_c0_g1~~TRINITY_DN3085_c0_g1_i2.p1  ORF type:complete len:717 (-),score=70.80 TRINITY_DN3085_c0_g1_i2:48-2198(-)
MQSARGVVAPNWSSDNDAATCVVHFLSRDAELLFENAINPQTQVCADLVVLGNTLAKHNIDTLSLAEVILKRPTAEVEEFLVSQIESEPTAASEPLSLNEITTFKKNFVKSLSSTQRLHAVANSFSFKLHKKEGLLSVESYEISPLSGLAQDSSQLLTVKGIVYSRPEGNRHRVRVWRHCLQTLGFPTLGSLPAPLQACGRDVVLVNDQLTFIGSGRLTDEGAIRHMLEKEFFGTERVAVIRDLFERSEHRATLSSVVRIISDKCVVVAEAVLGSSNPIRRIVDEYYRVDVGHYELSQLGVELNDYLTNLGFQIIKIPKTLEEEVGLGVSNAGMGRILTADNRVADLIKTCSAFQGTLIPIAIQPAQFKALQTSFLTLRKTTEKSCSVTLSKVDRSWPVWRPPEQKERKQTAGTVLMVAPVGFQLNEETAVDNQFMKRTGNAPSELEAQALLEFSGYHAKLRAAGVRVWLHSAERYHGTPDAVFPNNWFSTHTTMESPDDGSMVVFYPMRTPSRRQERRQHIVQSLVRGYDQQVSFTHYETADRPRFLESTGTIIMDHIHKIAYATVSQRCSGKVMRAWAERMGYQVCLFHSTDVHGRPIYHTNVMMSVGTTLAMVCLDSISNMEERDHLVKTLSATHTIMNLTREQVNNFCGNVLEISNVEGKRLLAMSTRAYNAFTAEQKDLILQHLDDIVHANLDIIETVGGGGARCMLGEVF